MGEVAEVADPDGVQTVGFGPETARAVPASLAWDPYPQAARASNGSMAVTARARRRAVVAGKGNGPLGGGPAVTRGRCAASAGSGLGGCAAGGQKSHPSSSASSSTGSGEAKDSPTMPAVSVVPSLGSIRMNDPVRRESA